MNFDRSGDTKQLAVKLLTGVAAIIVFISALFNVFSSRGYVNTLVCLYLMVFSIIIAAAEFSPLILEAYLLNIFPFLGGNIGKGILSLIIGSFCMESTYGFLSHTGGILIIIAGVANILLQFLVGPTSSNDARGFQHPQYNGYPNFAERGQPVGSALYKPPPI